MNQTTGSSETASFDAQHPSRQNWWSRLKKALGPVAVVGVVIAKFFAKLKFFILPALKFLPILLKSGGTMLLMIWVYTMMWGWKFAVGFVVLLLVHECGHLIVAKKFGLKVGAPVFIPFMGAFIALKEAPRNAWMEACVGIGGPMLGSLGAFACNLIDTIADPFWFFRLREDSAEGGIQGSRDRTSFRFGAFDAWHLCARLCRCGISQAWVEIRSQDPALRKLCHRSDDPHENHRQPENSSCDRHAILCVHVAPHFCKSSIK